MNEVVHFWTTPGSTHSQGTRMRSGRLVFHKRVRLGSTSSFTQWTPESTYSRCIRLIGSYFITIDDNRREERITPAALATVHGSLNCTARWKHIYPIKVRTERTTTQASSHLFLQRHGQIAHNRGVLGIVLALVCLGDFYRTTAETFGVLIFALRSRCRDDAATRTLCRSTATD